LRLQGWAASLLLHATLGSAAIWTMSDVTLIPKEETFRWDVSIVRTATGEPAAASASPSQAAAVPPTTPAPLTETQPPVVESPPPTPREVQAEPEPVRTAAAIERPVPPPAPVQEPVPPTPREVLRHEMTAQTEEAATPQVVAKAVPAEPPAAVGAATQDARPSNQPTQPASRPVSAAQGPKADYGWLAKSLWQRVAELKRYPHRARLNHWEGKVVLRAVIREDGHLEHLALHESSGYEELDDAAMELVREACPLHLTQPLGRPQVVVQVPITYALR
jgi:protein TonB